MDQEITYGPLSPERWQEYRDLWLEALRETPEAFEASYEEQKALPITIWEQRLKTVLEEKSAMMVFAHMGNVVAGMLGCYFYQNAKFAHIATIWGAYVKPQFRGKGIATKLAELLFQKIQSKGTIKKIKNYSITNAKLAVSMYQHFGFDISGISKKELCVDGQYFDVYIMEKILS